MNPQNNKESQAKASTWDKIKAGRQIRECWHKAYQPGQGPAQAAPSGLLGAPGGGSDQLSAVVRGYLNPGGMPAINKNMAG